jgi:hypothetical protein
MKVGDLVTLNFRFTSTRGLYNQFLENRIFRISGELPGMFNVEPIDGRTDGEKYLSYVFLPCYIDLLPEPELCQALNDVGLL